MEARKISVKLRRDPRETAERHSQANPLTLECTLATGEAVTETMELRAELHAAQTPATTPLAATATVNMTSGSTGPWDLEFSGAQMNQTVLPDSAEDFWLVIYATNAADDLFTLAKIGLTLTFDNVSQVTPAPPDPALFLDLGGTKWKTAENYLIDDVVALSGSIYVCIANNTSSTTNRPGTGASWTTFWTLFSGGGGGGGDVTGPASSTDNAITRFDGTTGKIIQNSTATLSDAGGISADTLAISTTPTGAGGTGIFRYDAGEKVPEVGIDGITLKIGVQEYVRVYNSTASTLTKGQVVYINGAQGNRVSVALSDASSQSTSAGTIGFVAQSITAGSEGFVQTSGPMYSLNTIGLTAGALLFLSETAGEWTATEPTAPAHGVRLGYVERVHATVGSVFIKINDGYELGELHNVSDGVTGAIAFLVKNASTNLWESKNAADSRTALGLGSLATQSGTFSGTSSGTNTGNVTLAAELSSIITLTGQQLGAVTDPGADRIVFFDQSANAGAGAWGYLTAGTGLNITGTTLTATIAGTGSELQVRDSATGALAAVTGTSVSGTTVIMGAGDNLGTGTAERLKFRNTTPAVNNTVQNSPAATWEGQAWNPVASASQPMEFRSYLAPIQLGGGSPGGRLVFESRTNSGSWTEMAHVRFQQGLPSGFWVNGSIGSSANAITVVLNNITTQMTVSTAGSWILGPFSVRTGSSDATLNADAAHQLAQRSGTNAQVFRVYDTFASATDYQRVSIATARAVLSGLSGASVTATSLIPAGAVVVGVTAKVLTAVTGATSWQLGTAADPDRFAAAGGIALGSTTQNSDWTAGGIECFPAATNLILTANGSNFTAGSIQISVQYLRGEAD
jgi:hypothetical protein